MVKLIIKTVLSFLLLIQISYADNVKLKFNALKFKVILDDNLYISQIQTKLRCHFIHSRRGNNMIRSRYPKTNIIQKENSVEVLIKKSSLTEYLPGFYLKNCAFVLIVLGHSDSLKTIMGDIILLGNIEDEMDITELDFMQSIDEANIFMQKRVQKLILGVSSSQNKLRIIEKI